jgi:hypothetical protein
MESHTGIAQYSNTISEVHMLETFFETEEARDCADLIHLNRASVARAYWWAWDNDMHDPVVVVLDLRDSKATAIAHSRFRNRNRMRKLTDKCVEKGVIPTVIMALPHDDALEAMSRVSQSARKALFSTIPRNYFRVMTIAFGGHIHTACPEPEREEP